MRSIEDLMDELMFSDAELLSVYIQGRDDHEAELKDERDASIERAMRAEQALVEMKLRLQQVEADMLRLNKQMTDMQQALALSNIKLGGIAMLLQGK